MAIVFLITGMILAGLGMKPKFRKNLFTGLTVGVGLLLFLLIAGVPVPGEVLLLALPTWLVAFMRTGKKVAKSGDKSAKEKD